MSHSDFFGVAHVFFGGEEFKIILSNEMIHLALFNQSNDICVAVYINNSGESLLPFFHLRAIFFYFT
jgi:hypothetical protein